MTTQQLSWNPVNRSWPSFRANRAESGDESSGTNIERLILDAQFRELEQEILDNPGAVETLAVYFSPGARPYIYVCAIWRCYLSEMFEGRASAI